MFYCEQCGRLLSPVEAVMGPVCGECVRENHRRVAGKRAGPRRRRVPEQSVRALRGRETSVSMSRVRPG